jgi:hypothetical protein
MADILLECLAFILSAEQPVKYVGRQIQMMPEEFNKT